MLREQRKAFLPARTDCRCMCAAPNPRRQVSVCATSSCCEWILAVGTHFNAPLQHSPISARPPLQVSWSTFTCDQPADSGLSLVPMLGTRIERAFSLRACPSLRRGRADRRPACARVTLGVAQARSRVAPRPAPPLPGPSLSRRGSGPPGPGDRPEDSAVRALDARMDARTPVCARECACVCACAHVHMCRRICVCMCAWIAFMHIRIHA